MHSAVAPVWSWAKANSMWTAATLPDVPTRQRQAASEVQDEEDEQTQHAREERQGHLQFQKWIPTADHGIIRIVQALSLGACCGLCFTTHFLLMKHIHTLRCVCVCIGSVCLLCRVWCTQWGGACARVGTDTHDVWCVIYIYLISACCALYAIRCTSRRGGSTYTFM